MNEIIVRVEDMPYCINGYTLLDGNGDFNIYLNARYSNEEQLKTYWHELRHIRRNDFYGDRPIELIENI